jgi:hypothetical protein
MTTTLTSIGTEWSELPFFGLDNEALKLVFKCEFQCFNEEFVKKITKACGRSLDENFCFKYYSDNEFSNVVKGLHNKINLSVFHCNIRSLNANQRKLIAFLVTLEYSFDVIVLSELWSNNIQFYNNILQGYTLTSDLPVETNVGGIGIFVKNSLDVRLLPEYNIASSENNKIENLWLEINRKGNKYIIGGCYRHPNQNISEFKTSLDKTLCLIASRKIPCVFAGDINIDLLKYETNQESRYN